MTEQQKKVYINWISELYPANFKDKVRFEWCTNNLGILICVFIEEKTSDKVWEVLNWNYGKSVSQYLPCDCFIGELNSLLVIDDFFKFSMYRLKTLEMYKDVPTYFDIEEYKKLCIDHHGKAESYQRTRKRTDFDFEGGAIAKRAMLDVMLDIKPLYYKLNPTIRLTEFELNNVYQKNDLYELINSKLKL